MNKNGDSACVYMVKYVHNRFYGVLKPAIHLWNKRNQENVESLFRQFRWYREYWLMEWSVLSNKLKPAFLNNVTEKLWKFLFTNEQVSLQSFQKVISVLQTFLKLVFVLNQDFKKASLKHRL